MRGKSGRYTVGTGGREALGWTGLDVNMSMGMKISTGGQGRVTGQQKSKMVE